MAYQRQAWLVLDGQTLYLDDFAAGYAMTELDLGFPEVRDVTSNKPIANGIDDRTQFFGSRVIDAKITAWPGGTVELDDIPSLFQPFLNPAARPELHITRISDKTPTEKVITSLRSSGFAAPMGPPLSREMELQWIASDPYFRDVQVKSVSAWTGSPGSPGRTYPLGFNRVYPPGTGAPVTGFPVNNGEVPVFPLVRIYGPITYPQLTFTNTGKSGNPNHNYSFLFGPATTIGAAQFIQIDCNAKTVLLNGTTPMQDQVNFQGSQWPLIWPVFGWSCAVNISGTSTSGVTQAQVSWQDRFLS